MTISRVDGSSPLSCVFAAQDESSRVCFGNLSTVLIGNLTLNIAHVLSPVDNTGLGPQPHLPYRRKKLMPSVIVVKDSSGASVDAKAMPIAASARSHKTPPWSVPIGLACCGPDCSSPTARAHHGSPRPQNQSVLDRKS